MSECCSGPDMNRPRTVLKEAAIIGIDSRNYPLPEREAVWRKLANEWRPRQLLDACEKISLAELSERIDLMLAGNSKGRTVVRL
ncbi:MAG: hypothetical protein ACOC9D_03950 [Thermodesulfobacteriota bacterium]